MLVFVANLSPVPRPGYRLGLPRSDPLARGDQHRLDLLRRQRRRQPGGGRARADSLARPARLGRDHAAAARGDLARPGVSALPWEQPLGARALEDGTAEFRVWAPRAGSVALRVGDLDTPMTDAGLGVYEVTASATRATTTGTCSTDTSCPIRARAGSRTGCAAPRGCSRRPPRADRRVGRLASS